MKKPVENLRPELDRETNDLLSRYGELFAESGAGKEEELVERFRQRLARQTKSEPKRKSRSGWSGHYGWLLAAACLLGLLIVPSLMDSPMGAVVYSTGEILVDGKSDHKGPLEAGTTLQSIADRRAMVSLDEDRINLFLNEKTRLTLDSKEQVALAEGELWIRVEPNSGTFGVATPHGRVEVHGTTFGVMVTESETRVSIAAGTVSVANGQGESFISPGQSATLSGDEQAPQLYPESEEITPEWAKELFNQASAARAKTFFPSAAP